MTVPQIVKIFNEAKNYQWAERRRLAGKDYFFCSICNRFHGSEKECYNTNWYQGDPNQLKPKRVIFCKNPNTWAIKTTTTINKEKLDHDRRLYDQVLLENQKRQQAAEDLLKIGIPKDTPKGKRATSKTRSRFKRPATYKVEEANVDAKIPPKVIPVVTAVPTTDTKKAKAAVGPEGEDF